nr:uncharacterized protein LOC127347328 [Lolium perenne]
MVQQCNTRPACDPLPTPPLTNFPHELPNLLPMSLTSCPISIYSRLHGTFSGVSEGFASPAVRRHGRDDRGIGSCVSGPPSAATITTRCVTKPAASSAPPTPAAVAASAAPPGHGSARPGDLRGVPAGHARPWLARPRRRPAPSRPRPRPSRRPPPRPATARPAPATTAPRLPARGRAAAAARPGLLARAHEWPTRPAACPPVRARRGRSRGAHGQLRPAPPLADRFSRLASGNLGPAQRPPLSDRRSPLPVSRFVAKRGGSLSGFSVRGKVP